jgi:hypothetical protein
MLGLICFDTDGTLECKEENSQYINGPVKLSTLERLSKDYQIVIVSPSPYYPKYDDGKSIYPIFAEYGSNTMRHKNLSDALKAFPTDGVKIYVSNNGDREEANKADFIFIDEVSFAETHND